MKRLALLSMLLLAASCGRQSAFEDLKAYMASTQQSRVDPEHLADIMSKVCRGDDSIPFLKQKLTSSDDPRDAVAAYVVLTELVAQARLHPTPEGTRLAGSIQPEELASEFSQVDVSGLTGNWSDWIPLTK